jgi:N-methylhydantoinase A
MSAVRLGIDTGGTFTDFVMVDEADGSVTTAKVPSTPEDPARAIRAGLDALNLERRPERLVVGTTVATNAVLERRGPRVVCVTNEGFEDVALIGRMDKERLYDLHWERPKPLVKRRDCLGIAGRLDRFGERVGERGDAATRALADELKQYDGEDVVVAICELFAYLHPADEQRTREVVRETLGDVPVSVSHEVAPVWREYERTSTTIADAFVKPVIERFIERVDSEIEDAFGTGSWHALGSNGGYVTATSAAARPSQLVLSGLAGGVEGARYFARESGIAHAFSLDMGGTSTDIGLIVDGATHYADEYELAFDLPIVVPCVSVETIGAGGGSILWIDRGGLLHVGPQSAGAVPGPVAYGRGGEQPTLTDANLVLGRIDPEFFLGGRMALDLDAARAAVAGLAGRLDMTPEELALAAITSADENMANAVRLIAVEQGVDPREFALMAFGGAGPLHAREVASRLGISTVVIPPAPGLGSAFGAAMAAPRFDRTQSVHVDSAAPDLALLEEVRGRLIAAATEEMARTVTGGERITSCEAAMRYAGQNHELAVDLPDEPIAADGWGALLDRFTEHHERRFGFALPGDPIEVTGLHATVRGEERPPEVARATGGGERAAADRRVWFSAEGPVDCPVHRRSELTPGARLAGPAVLEDEDATAIVGPRDRFELLASGSVRIDLEALDG